MASSIDVRRLDLDLDMSEGGRMAPIDPFAPRKAAISNAARCPRAEATELAARHSREAAHLPWSGMRV